MVGENVRLDQVGIVALATAMMIFCLVVLGYMLMFL